jgi:hypothetical protein
LGLNGLSTTAKGSMYRSYEFCNLIGRSRMMPQHVTRRLAESADNTRLAAVLLNRAGIYSHARTEEPGGWLYKDPSVQMETNYQGLTAGLLGGMRLACNRFTGPGRVGLQSMSVVFESSVADPASQTGTQTAEGTALGVIGAIAGGIFGNPG